MTNQKKKRGRPPMQNVTHIPSIIDFSKLTKLDDLDIDERMLESMRSSISTMNELFSEEGGIPCASNYMMIGDPGVGKTTVLLDLLVSIQNVNRDRKCLFISGEMGRKQMFKYTERFPHFGAINTLFMADYLEYNAKDVFEQILNKGWDLVLIDSAAEIVDAVRDDNNWDRKTAEAWFVDACIKQNKGENMENKFTSFLAIQQVTKQGEFVGSNKLKHLFDAMGEMRRASNRDGGQTYITFTKNRNGDVGIKLGYTLENGSISYWVMEENNQQQPEEVEIPDYEFEVN
jgi:predicted ATP-dependent serine protease